MLWVRKFRDEVRIAKTRAKLDLAEEMNCVTGRGKRKRGRLLWGSREVRNEMK